LGDTEINKLLKDALIIHLMNEGYSEYTAKIEAERRIARLKLTKESTL